MPNGIKKIIHVSLCNNFEALDKNLNISNMARDGLAVRFIVVGPIFGLPARTNKFYSISEEILTKETELKSIINQEKNSSVFNIQIEYEPRWKQIFCLFDRADIVTSKFEVGKFPRPKRSLTHIFRRNPREILVRVYSRLFGLGYYFYPKIIFSAGESGIEKYNGRSDIYFIENIEIARISRESKSNYYQPTAIFIDQYIPYHPDLLLTGNVVYSGEKYYSLLLQSLREISKACGVQIKIAAHPKADIKKMNTQEFEVLKGETQRLIEESQFVIAHYSTSIGMAIYLNKPIILLTSTCKTGVDIDSHVNAFARYLGLPKYLIGDKSVKKARPKINSERYMKYQHDFLCHPDRTVLTANQDIAKIYKKYSKDLH